MTAGGLDEAVSRSAAAAPEHIAVRSGQRQITYEQLETKAQAAATGLRDVGVQRGDRVAIALADGVDAAIAVYAVLRAGAALVPLNPDVKAKKLAGILADCSAKMLICDARLADVASEACNSLPSLQVAMVGSKTRAGRITFDELLRFQPRNAGRPIEVDLAAVIYTSGSTGVPKGVMLSHRNMTFAANAITRYLGMRSDDRVLSVLPLSFDYGLYQLLLCTEVSATLLLEPRVTYPGQVVSMMLEQKVTGLPGVPTLFRLLLALPGFSERRWPHLRFVTSTGSVLSAGTIHALRAAFPAARIYSMYGLTECKRVSYLPPEELDRRPDSVGIPIPGTGAWIENDAGERLGPGQVGQLMVRGPHVMQGYWNDPAATRERLREGQWPWEHTLATGDLFRCDEDGFLFFEGRQDDMIKSRGVRIYPQEIEQVLLAAPGVLDAAVIGVPNELLGQALCAHVALRPGDVIDARDVRRFCQARLEPDLVPGRIVIHPELPRLSNGKVDRRALADIS